MSTFTDESIPPAEETAVHKTDVLDWSGLESVASDFEFRDYFRVKPSAIPRIIHRLAAKMSLASLTGWVVAHQVAVWDIPVPD